VTHRTSYRGFLGRVRANLLFEQGLKFGADCHGVHLQSTISSDARRLMREHLEKPDVPQTKEEVFFALVVAVLPSLDAQTLLSLYQDIEGHAEIDFVSSEVRGHFMAAVAYLGPDQWRDISGYNQWIASRGAKAEG
jgi:hypothetical protein